MVTINRTRFDAGLPSIMKVGGVVPVTQELLDDANPPPVKPKLKSSAEMVVQGYRDARRKRFKVGVPHVWKEGDTVTASYLNRHAADALGQKITTEIMVDVGMMDGSESLSW